MPMLDRGLVRRCLRERNYARLFAEVLGWDHPGAADAAHAVDFDGNTYTLLTVAQKRGVQALLYDQAPMPDSRVRRGIERKLTRSAYQHIVIFAPKGGDRQIWQWSSRQQGQPVRTREKDYTDDDTHGEALIQSLEHVSFTLEEEGQLTHMDVVGRMLPIADAAPVTKRFYDRFKVERDA
ncbi:MAG: hypothetical protein GX601_01755, partial [Anaerolineales bacterium]|nr:hypothetical protein [Anaerolineales bacterium]